jgi:hypothetical protein
MASPPAPVVPCCTNCKGTGYSYRPETIAGVPGLLVYCATCGGIFSWSPHVLEAAKSVDGNAV